jgi:hypothetical protein
MSRHGVDEGQGGLSLERLNLAVGRLRQLYSSTGVTRDEPSRTAAFQTIRKCWKTTRTVVGERWSVIARTQA